MEGNDVRENCLIPITMVKAWKALTEGEEEEALECVRCLP